MPRPREPEAPEEPILPGDTEPQPGPDRRSIRRDQADEPERRGAPTRRDIEGEVPGTPEEDDDAQQQRRDMDERRPHREP
jgi:hypothetical protein